MDRQQQDTDPEFTVLCIDDDPEVSRALQLRFREYGVTVLRAFHGTHGLWLAKNERPDVIVTDVNMPQGQGDYVVECLKTDSQTCNIPIIVLSGLRRDELGHRLSELAVDACFTKPCEIGALVDTVRSYLKGAAVQTGSIQKAERRVPAP